MGSLILGSRTRTATADQPDVGLVVRDEEIRSPQDATIPITGGNLVLHPLDPETGYTFVEFVGPAASAVLPGPIVQLTYNPGVTTDLVMAAAVLADPASALLMAITGATGIVMPAGLGGTGGNLWQDLIGTPNAIYRRNPTNGKWAAWDGSVTVPPTTWISVALSRVLSKIARGADTTATLLRANRSASDLLRKLVRDLLGPGGESQRFIDAELARDVRGKLAGLRRGDDVTMLRAVRSELRLMLYEMQHPKQTIYDGPDVAIGAGGALVALSGWINVRGYRDLGYFIHNTGAQNVSSQEIDYAHDAAGTIWSGQVAAFLIAPGVGPGSVFSQDGILAAGQWSPAYFARAGYNYFRVMAGSALGSSARLHVIGVR